MRTGQPVERLRRVCGRDRSILLIEREIYFLKSRYTPYPSAQTAVTPRTTGAAAVAAVPTAAAFAVNTAAPAAAERFMPSPRAAAAVAAEVTWTTVLPLLKGPGSQTCFVIAPVTDPFIAATEL
jgi:hypothetical protein